MMLLYDCVCPVCNVPNMPKAEIGAPCCFSSALHDIVSAVDRIEDRLVGKDLLQSVIAQMDI